MAMYDRAFLYVTTSPYITSSKSYSGDGRDVVVDPAVSGLLAHLRGNQVSRVFPIIIAVQLNSGNAGILVAFCDGFLHQNRAMRLIPIDEEAETTRRLSVDLRSASLAIYLLQLVCSAPASL